MHYIFCPQCGTKLIERIAGDDGATPYCSKCNNYWFNTFHNCVLVMVINERKEVAMLIQPHLSLKQETFVSGFIIPGKTAEECAVRETGEELGIKIKRLKSLGTFWLEGRDQLIHLFAGYVRERQFQLSSEIKEAHWIPLTDIDSHLTSHNPKNPLSIAIKNYLTSIVNYQTLKH